MAKAPYKVTISKAMAEKFKLSSGDQLNLKVREHGVQLQLQGEKTTFFQQKMVIWTLILTTLATLGFVLYFVVNQRCKIPLSGSESIASLVILLGVITGTIIFSIFYIQNRNQMTHYFVPRVYWRSFPIIVISFAVILALLLLGSFWVLEHMFMGTRFDLFTATLIFFTFSLLIDYFMASMALTINANTLTSLFVAVFVTGVAIAMVTNGADMWWRHNLSYLGTKVAYNSWQFNATLILSAFIMLALIDYLFVSLKVQYPHSRRLTTLRIILMLVAIDLGAVGLFPNNMRFHWLHDHISMALVYWIIMLIIGIRWLLPKVTKDFLIISYILGGGLLVLDFLFQGIGYLSLTAFELSAFVAAFSWIMLLIQRIKRLIDTPDGDIVTIQVVASPDETVAKPKI